jgi:hypothetical protein
VSITGIENTEYLSTDIISTIHQILSIGESHGLSNQELIFMMKSVGEEMNLMNLKDKKLENVFPLEVVKLFAENYINGFLKMMTDLGFSKEKYIDVLKNQYNDNKDFDHEGDEISQRITNSDEDSGDEVEEESFNNN